MLEYNEVCDVVKKYTDMGGFYTWEKDGGWNSRGNKLNHNYIHDAPQANGIYQDQFSSGDSNTYNIIANVVMAVYNNYGYFNSYTNNIISNDIYPVTCKTTAPSNTTYPVLLDPLKELLTTSAVYRKPYPECANMVGSPARNNAPTPPLSPS